MYEVNEKQPSAKRNYAIGNFQRGGAAYFFYAYGCAVTRDKEYRN
jgi:hypothetical protein